MGVEASVKSKDESMKLKIDTDFYVQRNKDDDNNIIPLDDIEMCRMRGTDEWKVHLINGLETIHYDESTLKLILKRGRPLISNLFMKKHLSYYMRFLFYDFDKSTILFLFNAKLVEARSILTTDAREERTGFTIVSTGYNGMPAYRTIETPHWVLNV